MQRAKTVCLYLPPGVDEVLNQSLTWQAFLSALAPNHVLIRESLVHVPSACEVAITFDASRRGLVRFKRECARIPLKILVLMEPRCTSPVAFDLASSGFFSQVWAASPNWATRLDAREFPWPQQVKARARATSQKTAYEADAVLIAALKISGSSDSLYSLRRRFISKADNSGLRVLVGGPGWHSPLIRRSRQAISSVLKEASVRSMPSVYELTAKIGYKPKNYVGVVEDKTKLYRRAPWAVVMENSPDYVSEKLFDAISAGVAPIYIGPPLELFGLPNGVALQVAHSPDAMVQAIKDSDPSQIESIIRNGAEWMSSANAQRWDSVNVMRSLSERVSAYIASN